MARDGSDVYSAPAGTAAVSGDTVSSTKFNTLVNDLVDDLNLDRPIAAGGTGASTESAARDNLEIDAKIQDKSGAYTAVAGDRSTLIRGTAAFTLSLTDAATLGDGWFIDVLASSGAITIDPDASETIDGAATLTVPEGHSTRIRCNGTAFYSQFLALPLTGGTLTGNSGISKSNPTWTLTDTDTASSKGWFTYNFNTFALYAQEDASTDGQFVFYGGYSGDKFITIASGAVTFEAGVTETEYNLTGTDIDPANGTIQYKTLTENTTFTESLSNGQSVLLAIDDGTAYTVTWPTITWVSGGGSAPTLQTSGYTFISIWKMNGTLYGSAANGA